MTTHNLHLPHFARHQTHRYLNTWIIGCAAGIFAALGDGTFCFALDGVLGLPREPLRLVGPGLILGIMAYWAHTDGLSLNRKPAVAGMILSVTAAWALAYSVGLMARTQPTAMALPLYAVAGTIGSLGLIAGVQAMCGSLPPARRYALPLLALGMLTAIVHPLIWETGHRLVTETGSSLYTQRLMGNLLFFAPWQMVVLTGSLLLLRRAGVSDRDEITL